MAANEVAWRCRFRVPAARFRARLPVEANVNAMSRAPIQDWLRPARFAALLALLLAAAFPDVLFAGRSFFYRDFGVLAYPTVFYHREAFWHGQLPLWNPLSDCGVPFLAQWGTMVLYPGALVYLLLPLPWSLNFFCLAHLWLAGFGMYALARRWTGSHLAASLAGIAFVFNGVTQSCLLWPNYTVALGWMPWVVATCERAMREGGRATAIAAIVSALQLLAGVPELAAMTWLVVLTGALLGADDATTLLRRRLLRLAGVLALTLGLCAAQLLPFFDLLARSQRGTGLATTKWALPPWGFVNLLVPLFHCYRNLQGLFFQSGQEFFSSVYLGGTLLALAALAAVRARDRRVLPLAIWSLLGLALSFGDANPAFRIVPLIHLARYPVKFLLLTTFAVPLLAAFGLKALLPESGGHQTASSGSGAVRPAAAIHALWLITGAWVVFAGTVIWIGWRNPAAFEQPLAMTRNTLARVAFWLASAGALRAVAATASRPLLITGAAGLLAGVWLDFLTHTPRQNPSLPAQCLQPGLGRAGPLPRAGRGRAFITPTAEAALLHSRVADPETDYLGKRLAQWSNLNLLDGVAKVNGAATLHLREEDALERRLYHAEATPPAGLLDLLGAACATTPDNPTQWMPRPSALPLVTAGQQPEFVRQEMMLQRLGTPGFDPRRAVLLPPSARSSLRTIHAAPATVTKVNFQPQKVTFEVEAGAPALVVVAQSYHPNWQARVNGNAAVLEQADCALQALAVPAGRNRVTLTYTDRRFQLGAALSITTLLLIIVMVGKSKTAGGGSRRRSHLL